MTAHEKAGAPGFERGQPLCRDPTSGPPDTSGSTMLVRTQWVGLSHIASEVQPEPSAVLLPLEKQPFCRCLCPDYPEVIHFSNLISLFLSQGGPSVNRAF